MSRGRRLGSRRNEVGGRRSGGRRKRKEEGDREGRVRGFGGEGGKTLHEGLEM